MRPAHTYPVSRSHRSGLRLAVLRPRGRLSALPEAVLEAARQLFHVLHAAGSGGMAALRLLAPVVGAHLLRGVAAARALLLLVVEGPAAAADAQAVRLRVPHALRGGAVAAS